MNGAFQRDPGGGWVAVLELTGPRDAPVTQGYADWALAVVDWLNTVNSPAQVFTEAARCDRAQAQNAFERGLRRDRTVRPGEAAPSRPRAAGW